MGCKMGLRLLLSPLGPNKTHLVAGYNKGPSTDGISKKIISFLISNH